MPMTKSEAGRLGGRASAARRTPEEHAATARMMRRKLAMKEISRQWAALSDDERAALSEALAKGGGPR